MISKVIIEEKLKGLMVQKNELLATLNANAGAIQICEQLLAEGQENEVECKHIELGGE